MTLGRRCLPNFVVDVCHHENALNASISLLEKETLGELVYRALHGAVTTLTCASFATKSRTAEIGLDIKGVVTNREDLTLNVPFRKGRKTNE